MTDVFEIMQKYGRLLTSQEYSVGEHAKMVLETEEGIFATVDGADLSDLKPEDMVEVSLPKLPVPQRDMKAMIYSQTPYAQICLREGRGFQASLDDMAQIIGPSVKIADGRRTATANGRSLMKALRSNVGCLVLTSLEESGAGQGYTVTLGRNLFEAITAMTVLEKNAEVTVLADRIGGAKPLNKIEAALMRRVYIQKYSRQEAKVREEEAKGDFDEATACNTAAEKPAYSPEEAELRQALVDCGIRLVRTGLVQGTWGNISVRLDDKYMLVTPSGLDYLRLTPDDMVKVDITTMKHEGSIKPTSEKGLHAEIYKRRPDVKAVVHTHSKYLSVFAAAEEDMPVLKEYQDIFGANVALAAYGLPGSDKLSKNTADALGDNFGVIMSHHGMAAVGADLDTAFENCVKLEENGKAFLFSRNDYK